MLARVKPGSYDPNAFGWAPRTTHFRITSCYRQGKKVFCHKFKYFVGLFCIRKYQKRFARSTYHAHTVFGNWCTATSRRWSRRSPISRDIELPYRISVAQGLRGTDVTPNLFDLEDFCGVVTLLVTSRGRRTRVPGIKNSPSRIAIGLTH